MQAAAKVQALVRGREARRSVSESQTAAAKKKGRRPSVGGRPGSAPAVAPGRGRGGPVVLGGRGRGAAPAGRGAGRGAAPPKPKPAFSNGPRRSSQVGDPNALTRYGSGRISAYGSRISGANPGPGA